MWREKPLAKEGITKASVCFGIEDSKERELVAAPPLRRLILYIGVYPSAVGIETNGTFLLN
jgi:hypothetical protein